MRKSDGETIVGIGTDIIETERIREAITRRGDRFLERLFSEREIDYCRQYRDPTLRFAGRFAAKEAIFKAFGTGEVVWGDVEVLNDMRGKPEVVLSERLRAAYPGMHLALSISHCQAYATATAILIEGGLRGA